MKNLILLHGAMGAPVQFEALKQLLTQDFKIHIVAFAGHGAQEVPAALTMSALVNQLEGFIERESMQGAKVFGYSMGGYAALTLAARRPELFGKIFTLGTKMNWTPEGAAKEGKMLNPDTIAEKVPNYAAYLQKLHGDHWKELCNATAHLMKMLGERPLLNDETFATIKVPVIIGLGDADKMVSREETMQAASLIPGAGLCILPNTPHPLEKVSVPFLAGMIRLLLT